MKAAHEHASDHTMQCMEIWGGNRAAQDAVSMPGIDCWVYAEPHERSEAGGDIHYISSCASGRIARIVVADVAGHGELVSELAIRLRSLMRRHINTPDQTRFTRALNKEFLAQSSSARFATALLATYFTPTKQLIVCNAGHPRPLHYSASTRDWTVLRHDAPSNAREAADLPLGIIEPTKYHQFALTLERGDLVLIYTDSLSEAADASGGMLGEQGLIEIARSIDPGEPQDFIETLISRVRTHRGGAMPDDDVTAVLLHHNAADPPRYTLGERFTAIGRMLGLSPV